LEVALEEAPQIHKPQGQSVQVVAVVVGHLATTTTVRQQVHMQEVQAQQDKVTVEATKALPTTLVVVVALEELGLTETIKQTVALATIAIFLDLNIIGVEVEVEQDIRSVVETEEVEVEEVVAPALLLVVVALTEVRMEVVVAPAPMLINLEVMVVSILVVVEVVVPTTKRITKVERVALALSSSDSLPSQPTPLPS
jgi:hypothetical protein